MKKGILLFVFFAAITFGIQPLFADAVADAQVAVAKAEAALADAQTVLSRAQTAVEQAEAAVADAEAALAQAKADLAEAEAAATTGVIIVEEVIEVEEDGEVTEVVIVEEVIEVEDGEITEVVIIEEVIEVETEPAAAETWQSGDPLPATYTVRSWAAFKDCFWTIAGYPFVYGNPQQWRRLYEANKAKLPDPNNPNVIEPGTVLNIPSIRGEVRQGAWGGDNTATGVSDTYTFDTSVYETDATEADAAETDVPETDISDDAYTY